MDRSKDEIIKLIEPTDKETAADEDILSFLSRKPSSKYHFLRAESGSDQRDWKFEEAEEHISKNIDENYLEELKKIKSSDQAYY